MLGIGGPSKAELQERIDQLERQISNVRRTADANDTQIGNNVRAIQHMLEPYEDWRDYERLEKEVLDKVETLDEGHVVFKATQDCLIAIVVPKGETVVHPDEYTKVPQPRHVTGYSSTTTVPRTERIYKKRISGGIVAAVTVPMSGEQKWIDTSLHTGDFEYALGSWVEPDEFDEDTSLQCTHGIHVFATPKEAHTWLDRA